MSSRPGTIWSDDTLRDPHAVGDKQRRVRDMFAAIAPSYDLNNRLHSLGTDTRWRKKAVRLSRLGPGDLVVDVACGTGDLTLAYVRALRRLRGRDPVPGQVVGVDYTFEMLGPAVTKRGNAATYLHGDARTLPLPDACCDVVSIAFGIRNVADPARALSEFRRVLRPGGRAVVLEFSKPTNRLIRVGYDFYFNSIMTRTASWLSGDRTGAYRYLSASVETFKTRQQMADDLRSAGFTDVQTHPLTFGIAVIYVANVAP